MKEINWKDILWKVLKILLFVILNTPLLTYVIGEMVVVGSYEYNKQTFDVSWTKAMIDQGPWYVRIIWYLAIAATIILTIWLIKWLWENKKHQETINQNNMNTQAIINAINENKQETKEQLKNDKQFRKQQKDIDNFL